MPTRRPKSDNRRAAWLRKAMTPEEAREVLGFPPFYMPSEAELNKAVRLKARDAHPDRGGSTEAMMLVNVAKEVLEGKRPNDRTDVGGDAKQRKLDLATIEAAKKRARAALKEAVSTIGRHVFIPWAIDIREYLTSDYTDALDSLHDHVTDAVKSASGKREARLRQVIQATRDALSVATRIGSKLKALKKRTDAPDTATVESLDALCGDFARFKPMAEALFKQAGKLNQLLDVAISNEDEADVVPERLSEPVFEGYQMIRAFRDDWGRFPPDCEVAKVGREVESAVTEVLEVLKRRGSQTSTLPPWNQWDSSVFTHAATLVDRRTNASRVADRYFAAHP